MNEKRYGEFFCPHCGEAFHDRKKLSGHIGGAHRRGVTEGKIPRCKVCHQQLQAGHNWPEWAIKQRNLICKGCKNIQNRKSYRNKANLRSTVLKDKLPEKPDTLEDIKRRLRNG
jgi:predicted RNA-binding Zn-ribbon protein involved in translation (DUF1610 family)